VTTSERVEVWVDGVGMWHWRYVDDRGDEPVVLEGNEAVESEDAAAGNARIAYPGLPTVQITDPGWRPSPVSKRLSRAAAAVLLLARRRHRRRHEDGE
jgi:hypothetical protein